MQAYNQSFARLYNQRWTGFAGYIFPWIYDFYSVTPLGHEKKPVLDLCCGTGQLAVKFLEKGYPVVGLDLSPHMLACAQENAKPYLASGQAKFVQGDAGDFTINECFGLVVSTYDALNHLADEAALEGCFQCAAAVCEGHFIFDLNTRLGLRRWNGVQIDDSREDSLLITRGIFDETGSKAWTRITGFVRTEAGLFKRCDQTAFNTVFEMEQVREMLLRSGWRQVTLARIEDLNTPLSDPEKEGRVFFVASK